MLYMLLSWSNYIFFVGFKCHTACDLACSTLNANECVLHCTMRNTEVSSIINFHCIFIQIWISPFRTERTKQSEFFPSSIHLYFTVFNSCWNTIDFGSKNLWADWRCEYFGWHRCEPTQKNTFSCVVCAVWLCGNVKWNELIMFSLHCETNYTSTVFGMCSTFWCVNQMYTVKHILYSVHAMIYRWKQIDSNTIRSHEMSFENCIFFLSRINAIQWYNFVITSCINKHYTINQMQHATLNGLLLFSWKKLSNVKCASNIKFECMEKM